jgi:ADP-heptose:LPS heptosyltransferase
MNKILIINLKKYGDIFQTGHLVSSIKKKSPAAEITLLCFEESLGAAKILKGIKSIQTIDRKKIISFYKNSIYSDGLAFNQIEKSLQQVLGQTYDRVINYSNDRISSYLTSYITEVTGSNHAGIMFTGKQSINYSSQYSIILNDIVTSTPFTPYSFNDCYHLINELSIEPSTGVKSNKLHDQTAQNNLNRLRKMKNDDVSVTSIIGLQLQSGEESKDIPKEVMVATIDLILKSEEMIPILLIGPFEKERALASELNAHFENKLVSVEADFIALPSVLKSIDLVVTPDTSIKHLCDLLNTACVEVSLGASPLFKQGSLNTSSAIISAPGHQRNFKGSLGVSNTHNEYEINPNLIFNTSRLLLGLETNEFDFNNEKSNHCVYRPIKVLDGVALMPISGPINESFEIKRLLSRSIVQNTITNSLDENYIEAIANRFDRQLITKVINEEKEALSGLTKELLSTLRGLIQTQENPQKAPLFIAGLEKLLAKCFDNSLSAIPTMIFRAKIESLNSDSMKENFKEVEGLLYELKDNLQHSIFTYSVVERISQEAFAKKRRTSAAERNRDNTL